MMKMSKDLLMGWTMPKKSLIAACVCSVAMLSGCSSSTQSTMSGTVSAPGGSVAFNEQHGIKEMLAEIFAGKLAHAAITGVSPVGAGVTIELIEVDASGNKVGATLASTITDTDGSYSLVTPDGFVPSSKYVIRATGTTETLDTRVTSSTTNNVDPVTDVVSDLVTSTASDLSTISTDEITTIQDAVETVAQDVDATGLSASTLSSTLLTTATNNEEVANQISSTAAGGQICGNVKDSSSNNLENIVILVRDYGNWVTRAKTKTDASGNYCVNVPYGSGKNYIIGALNFTGTSTAASEWWSTGGTAYSQIDAEKVSVPDTTKLTRNFTLEPGARISGTITAGSGGSYTAGTALQNIRVQIRNYQNFFPVAGKKSKSDGTYRINVIPGTYMIAALNKTLQPYASEYYTASGGVNMYYTADSVTVSAGDKKTINFALSKGYKLTGTILDNTGGNAVTGMRIRINKFGSGPVVRLRTNKQGKYRVWLAADTYFAEAYGQSISSIDMTTGNATWSPTGPVTAISTNVKYSGTGVSQAKVWLLDSSGATISQEVSSSDGSITLYCKTCATNYKAYVLVDDARSWGTSVYDSKTDITTNATAIDATQTTMPDINLPAGGTLTVNVTSDGTAVVQNFKTRVLTGSSGTDYILKVQRTHGDGTYKLSLPAGTWRIKMIGDSTPGTCTVNITAGGTTTLNYRTDTNVCS